MPRESNYDLVCPTAKPLPYIPDDLTVAQFFLDSSHPTRPIRDRNTPWVIEDHTGKAIGLDELRARTFGFANALFFKYSIREDDVVVIFSPNHVDYPVAIWGVHRLGAIVSCANPAYTPDELAFQLTTTKATLIIAHTSSLATALTAARVVGIPLHRVMLLDTVHGSDVATMDELIDYGLGLNSAFKERRLRKGEAKTKIAFLSFSSGTTGRPKAVTIPHISTIANVIQLAVHEQLTHRSISSDKRRWRPGDIALGVLPFFHIYGLIVNLHCCLYSGMSLVVVNKFNFTEMLESIKKHKVTHLLLVPPQALLLCKREEVKKYDFSHVRFAMVGAAPVSDELARKLKIILPNAAIGQGYGMTETATAVTIFGVPAPGVPEVNSCGHILPGIVCRIVKEDGSFGSYGDRGELLVKSPSSALCYSNNEQATQETFVDGWVRTGDSVVIDKNGELYVVDRLKEMMKVKGFQVAPAELEGCLLSHADVSDTCVVGVPDDYTGEVPLAFVVLGESASARLRDVPGSAAEIKNSIMKYVADRTTAYKQLAGGVEFIDAIPKNPSGKLLRRLLRERAKALRKQTKPKL